MNKSNLMDESPSLAGQEKQLALPYVLTDMQAYPDSLS